MKGKIYICLVLINLLSSCSEFLVVEPDSQVSITEQFATPEGLYQALNGMYYNLESLYTGKLFIYADMMGGNSSFPPAENDRILEIPGARNIDQVYEFRDLADDSDMASVYAEAYQLINAANLIIEHIGDNGQLSEKQMQQVTAETLVCRAFAHYIIAVLYAQNYAFTPDASHPGIVYNTRTIISGVDYPARESIENTWLLMKADMENALALFTDTQALPYGEANTYFNGFTSAALMARMALQMNDWDVAWHYSDSVIRHSSLGLMPDSSYVAQWEDPEASLSETILELFAPRSSDGSVSASVAREHYIYNNVSNYSDFVASRDLLDLYEDADIRKGMFLEVLLPTSENGILIDRVYHFTRKFQVEKSVPAIRLSEMFLIRAEAAVRSGMDPRTKALPSLNAIRFRAGLSPLVSADNILEEIFRERRRELAFENFYLFDLARYQKSIVRGEGCISSVCSLDYPADQYVLPIPENTVLLNEFMEQNNGY